MPVKPGRWSAIRVISPVLLHVFSATKAAAGVVRHVDTVVFVSAAHERLPFCGVFPRWFVSRTDSRDLRSACCWEMYWPVTAERYDWYAVFGLAM